MAESTTIAFLCSECGTAVSGSVRSTVAPPRGLIGEDMIPAGYFATSDGTLDLPDGWPMFSREDLLGALVGPFFGCCGPSGFEHPNYACRNGHLVGIEQSECYLPRVSILDPDRVVRVTRAPDTPAPVLLARHRPFRTFADFCAALHEAFGLTEWHGENLPLILGKWGCRSPERIDLVWMHSAVSRAYGLPMGDIEASFAEQAQFVRHEGASGPHRPENEPSCPPGSERPKCAHW